MSVIADELAHANVEEIPGLLTRNEVLAFEPNVGDGGIHQTFLYLEGSLHRTVVAQHLAVLIDHVVVLLEVLQDNLIAVFGIDVDNLVDHLALNQAKAVHEQRLGAVFGIVALAGLYPGISTSVPAAVVQAVNEQRLQLFAGVAAVGVAHDNLGMSGVCLQDAPHELSNLRLAGSNIRRL